MSEAHDKRHTRSRNRRPWIRRAPMLAAGFASVVVLVTTALLWGLTGYAMDKVERVTAFERLGNRPDSSPGVNLLLVGSDRREGMSREMVHKLHLGRAPGQRSDTMILAHISPRHDSATLVSLPRDWYVEIPAHRDDKGQRVPADKDKLNTAYSSGGANLTVRTVEHNTDIRIDHYVEVNFLGFVDVVNALGGVDVCTPVPVDDPASGLKLPAGTSHLNGVQGLQYVRARKTLGSGSDLERIDRQQKFLGAMMQRAVGTGTLLNPFKFTDFLNAALRAVRVDNLYAPDDLRRLAMILRDLQPERMKFVTVPIADAGMRADDGQLVAAADREKAAALFTRLREDDMARRAPGREGKHTGGARVPTVSIPPERIELEVYNGTRKPGLGKRAGSDLGQQGFLIEQPPRPAKAPLDAGKTVVQYGPSRGDSARTVRAAIPGARTRMIPKLGNDIQVVVGSSYRGTRRVKVSTGSGHAEGKPDARTAAENPCS